MQTVVKGNEQAGSMLPTEFIGQTRGRFTRSAKHALNAAAGLLVAIAVAILFTATIPGNAQTTTGSIVGTITDPAGNVIADAPVQLINEGTSVQLQATTSNASGFYQFIDVPPGTYRIEAQKKGFKRVSRGSILLQISANIQVNLPMQVGSSTQTVMVTASSPLIEAETVSLGAVINQRETNDLPLNGRNPMNLTYLVPSVVPLGQTSGSPTGVNPFGWGNYQIGGGMAGQSLTYIDGAPDNTPYINLTAYIPTQDSVREFKVETNNLSAQYGGFAGGIINFTTKSGTSSLHGSAWEYLRNKVLNANTYFGNLAGLAKPAFTQNQYGFDVGGPVVIPHVYDGRKKTFFFASFEGFALRQGLTITTSTPTLAERGGNGAGADLSALGVPIYDPTTTCGVPNDPTSPACAPGTPQYQRTQFPNAVIPASKLNPTSLLYLQQFFPLPNTPGINGQNNLTATAASGGNNYQTVVHMDEQVSDKQSIDARYTYWKNHNLAVDPFHNGICANGSCAEFYRVNGFVINDNYMLNPKTILHLSASYLRFQYNRTPDDPTFRLTQIGMPASLASQVQFPGPPSLVVAGYDTAGLFGSQSADSTIVNATDNYHGAGMLTKFIGNHTISLGGEYTKTTFNYAQNNISSGLFNFNNGFTAENPLTAVGGAGLASFLLGYPNSGSAMYTDQIAAEQVYPAFYVTDEWRASSKLTFHLGLRWEETQPFTERHNRISYFDSSAPNPILQGAGLGIVPGSVQLVDSATRHSRYGFNPDKMQFSPRTGLTYQIAQNTVLDMGYGIFWLPNDVANSANPGWDQDASYTTPYTASINGGLTPANNISNPFPGGIIRPADRNLAEFQQNQLGTGISEDFPNNPYAYAQQWNIGLQQQIGNSAAVSVAYAGSKGTHLPFGGLQTNQLPDQLLSLGPKLVASVPNPYFGIVNPTYSLGAATTTAGQLLLKYPQYAGVSSNAAGYADSTYNAMEVKFQKRFPKGASINVAYTWAKMLSDTDDLTGWLEATAGIQDANNLKGEKSLSSGDIPQHLVIAYVYDVPVGQGKAVLTNIPRAANYVVGGWSLEGITDLMKGFPLGLTTNQNLTHSYGGGSRPNYTSGCSKTIGGAATKKLSEWFNTSCFTQPAAFTFGDEPRNDPQMEAPGVADWDFSLVKAFPVDSAGRFNVQFRAEFFNLFNRVQFGVPGTVQGQAGFGIVNSQANLPRVVQFALRLDY